MEFVSDRIENNYEKRSIFSLPHNVFQRLPGKSSSNLGMYGTRLTLSQMTKFNSYKLKESADDNFKFDENGRKFLKWVENTVGEGEIAYYEQFILFPQCFRKTYTADT